MSEPGRSADVGLQAERTALAWERTSLAFVLVAALLVRAGVVSDVLGARLLGVAILGVAGLGLLLGRRRYVERDRSLRGQLPGPGAAPLALVGGAAVVVSVGAVATAIAITLAV